MKTEELVALLEQVRKSPSESLESEVVEFKEYRDVTALHNSKDLSDELVALANLNGGSVVVGVRDSSSIPNSDWPSQLIGFPQCDVVEIRERLSGRISPKIPIKVLIHEVEGRFFLTITVGRRLDGLVTTTSGKVYIRDGRSSRPMTPDEISAAVKSQSSYDWSSEILAIDSATAIDQEFLAQAKSKFVVLRKVSELDSAAFLEAIGATRNGKLTKGGLLFLGTQEAIREVVGILEFRFSWKTKSGELKVNDVWEGCLWEAVRRSQEHFVTCNKFMQFEWKGVKHGIPLLDASAFHEAYLNALTHRDYSIDGMVSVDFHGKKMVVSSPGGFYGGVTSENIYKHPPRHRNKALAKILMDFNLVDRAGMGVKRMSLRSLMYGRSFPQFHERETTIEVSMDAEYMRPAIFVVAHKQGADYGVLDLLVLNSVFEVGAVLVEEMESRFAHISDSPWKDLQDVVSSLPHVEFVANREGVYVQIRQAYAELFEVSKRHKPSRVGPKILALYMYLKKHGSSGNADISEILGYSHSSQTSAFLRKTAFVERVGEGPAAVWRLTKRISSASVI